MNAETPKKLEADIDLEIKRMTRTIGSLLWLDNLTFDQWATLWDEIIPAVHKHAERRVKSQ